MTLRNEDEVVGLARHLTGIDDIAYVGSRMSTWFFKEHELSISGVSENSILVMSGTGNYLLFMGKASLERNEPEFSGHLEDTPFGTGRRKAVEDLVCGMSGIAVRHTGWMDFSGFLRGSILIPIDETEGYAFLAVEKPDGNQVSIFLGENPVQYRRSLSEMRDVTLPEFGESAIWSGALDRMETGEISINISLRISDPVAFSQLVETHDLERLTSQEIVKVVNLHDDPERLGVAGLSIDNIDTDGDLLKFRIVASISDWRLFSSEARSQYGASWGDAGWFPASPEEALFEIGIASNANESPDIHGFEIIDWAPAAANKPEGADLSEQEPGHA